MNYANIIHKNKKYIHMKKLFIILLSVLSLTAVAQRPKMAVYTLGNDTRNELLQDYLVSVFSESGKYSVVERTPQFLKALQQEYTFQQSGLVDEEELSKIGKQYGIRYICIAEEYEIKETLCLAIRMIDVETAAQVGNYYSFLTDDINLYRLISYAKGIIEAQMERPNVSKKKVAVHVVNYDNSPYMKDLENQLTFHLVLSDKYRIVDRSARIGKKIVSEMGYQQSGMVDENDIIQAGKQLGADYICVARIIKDRKDSYINTRLIDVETGEVQSSSMTKLDEASGLKTVITITFACRTIYGETSTEIYEKRVAINSKKEKLRSFLENAMQNPRQQIKEFKYKGCLLKDVRCKMGVLTSDRGFYAGQWEDGYYHGKGLYMLTEIDSKRYISNCDEDSKIYVGEWEKGKKNGKGKLYNNEGKMTYYGEFKDDIPIQNYLDSIDESCTFEILEFPNKSLYVGETKDTIMHGLGLYIWSNGDMQYGKWSNGAANGKCIYIRANGLHETCIKKGNTIVSDDKFVDLGLSSGTRWAKKCERAGFYTFKEAIFSSYMAYGEDAIKEWMIPTKDLWEELLEECTWEWRNNCYWVKGPNGNGIYLYDFKLIHDYSGQHKPNDSGGHFWTSEPFNDELVWTFSFSKDFKIINKRKKDKKAGLHLVKQY